MGDLDLILVRQPAGPPDTAAIEVGSVGAAQVDQPILLLSLRMHHRMPARNLVARQNETAVRGAAEETRPANRGRVPTARFKPASRIRLTLHEATMITSKSFRHLPISCSGRVHDSG